MRKIKLSFSLILMFFVAMMPGKVFADTENFYFEDFTGDYYLSREDDGTSRLKVVESFTTIFPEYKQNKGICRMIPFTNQDGANVTLPSLTTANIKVTRNGVSEPIYSIEKSSGNSYEVCTGDENYVMGRQVYTFEYNFEKVVTDFENYQELYWDTNGNGWTQRFNKVTAKLHFVGDVKNAYVGKNWCYVGVYGANEQGRCTVSEISDGVKFESKMLTRGENLTFDVELKPGSFVVPEPTKNYTLVFVMIGFLIVCFLCLINPVRKFLKTREKARYYKGLFVKPEFTPDRNYNVAEMAEIYIGNKRDAKVAVLLDMIVNHHISLIQKGETKFGRKKWAVKVLNVDGVSREGMYLLKILAGGANVEDGDEIEIKTRTATSALVSLKNSYEKTITDDLKKHGLIEETPKSGAGLLIVVVLMIIGVPMLGFVMDISEEIDLNLVGQVVGKEVFMPVMAGILVTTIVVYAILKSNTTKFLYRTKDGLRASRYMDGLRLYIGMAEKDRLKFMQSVEGADVTTEGVVRLYEKLLPYAAVFGLEKSWMDELEKYYKLNEIDTPDWYMNQMATYTMLNAVNSAVSTVNYSTTYASSGGGSSSGFSGGGGGGFSGGGGGGGGGHGR